ncbi:helix-turn-helix domain-containing protein [Desulforamulus reducens]|uniref:helix-turn-helix domain-containing protein n=1 Tax=Desulforamulus reducens TaxID=59610 RepID=UPI0002D77505|nr:helix-turn-helix transcriptional regulator [Desulforamulus reducens]
MKLRNKLKHWRHRKEMEQKEFAAFLGYDLSTYNRWERQAVQPNLITTWVISKKLGIHMDELFEEVEE